MTRTRVATTKTTAARQIQSNLYVYKACRSKEHSVVSSLLRCYCFDQQLLKCTASASIDALESVTKPSILLAFFVLFFFKRKTWFCVWVFAQRAATHRQFVCHKLDLRRIALPSLRYLCVLSNILSLHSKYMLCLQSVPLSISMDCIAVYILSFFQYPHYIAVIVRSFSWTRFGLHSHVSAEPQHDYDNNSNDSKLRCVLCV